MKTEITDAVGVTMAGPDEPALAAAKARDVDGVAEEARSEAYLRYCDQQRASGRHPFNYEEWLLKRHEEISQLGLMRAGSVGDIAQRQAGILPTGRVRVSDEMVGRAQREGADRGQLLDTGFVRAMLEAALHG